MKNTRCTTLLSKAKAIALAGAVLATLAACAPMPPVSSAAKPDNVRYLVATRAGMKDICGDGYGVYCDGPFSLTGRSLDYNNILYHMPVPRDRIGDWKEDDDNYMYGVATVETVSDDGSFVVVRAQMRTYLHGAGGTIERLDFNDVSWANLGSNITYIPSTDGAVVEAAIEKILDAQRQAEQKAYEEEAPARAERAAQLAAEQAKRDVQRKAQSDALEREAEIGRKVLSAISKVGALRMFSPKLGSIEIRETEYWYVSLDTYRDCSSRACEVVEIPYQHGPCDKEGPSQTWLGMEYKVQANNICYTVRTNPQLDKAYLPLIAGAIKRANIK